MVISSETKVSGMAHLRLRLENTTFKSPTDSKGDVAGSWMRDMTSEERSSEDGTGVSSQELHKLYPDITMRAGIPERKRT